jgi:hypothetical protein
LLRVCFVSCFFFVLSTLSIDYIDRQNSPVFSDRQNLLLVFSLVCLYRQTEFACCYCFVLTSFQTAPVFSDRQNLLLDFSLFCLLVNRQTEFACCYCFVATLDIISSFNQYTNQFFKINKKAHISLKSQTSLISQPASCLMEKSETIKELNVLTRTIVNRKARKPSIPRW